MLNKNDIRRLQERYGFTPHKRLGQNFLIDANIKDKIIASLGATKDDTVLEIGAGLGQLTLGIAAAAGEVIAVEYDKKLFSILAGIVRQCPNVRLVHADILKCDLKKFTAAGRKLKVVSNLPYSISSPVIFKLVESRRHIEEAVLTLQKEVADRLTARPRSKDYGAVTLLIQFRCQIRHLFKISRNSFYPAPNVDSAVVLIRFMDRPAIDIDNESDFSSLIKASFSKRRKTLINALSSHRYNGLEKSQLEVIFEKAGINPKSRAEELTLHDFARLYRYICIYEI